MSDGEGLSEKGKVLRDRARRGWGTLGEGYLREWRSERGGISKGERVSERRGRSKGESVSKGRGRAKGKGCLRKAVWRRQT